MTIDPNIWTNTLFKTKSKVISDESEVNSNRWVESIPQKLENIPKKKDNLLKKYSLVSTLFIFGLIVVSFIKNETRNLEKEIANLKKSIYEYKYNLHQATLDHEVITSRKYIFIS